MSEREQQGDGGLYTTPDVYQSQSSQDIYQTPDTDEDSSFEKPVNGQFSGDVQSENGPYDLVEYEEKPLSDPNENGPYENAPCGDGQYGNGAYGNNPYENAPCGNGQYGNNSYGNDSYGNNQYGNGQYGNNPYGSNQYGGGQYENNPYGNNQYGSGQYENNSYGNNQCGSGQHGNNSYGNNQYGNGQYGNASYGSGQNGNAPYGNGNASYGNGQYGNGAYGNGQYGGPYGPAYGNGQYSPYAKPPGKKHTGLIIGIIITVAVLFLIALFALFYHAFEVMSENRMSDKLVDYNQGHEYDIEDFHDDNDVEPDDDYNDVYDDYNYDDDEYYTLHDDIRKLSYSIDWEYFEYDADNENVSIIVDYPEISGSHVPNLDKLNNYIENEIYVFTDYYEEEYSRYMNDDGSYFNAYASGYVTYMSEDVLSVVFSETVYTNYYNSAYLYCINIDMRDGVIMENTDIISVDDDFSIDFRYRSEEQNGTIDGVDRMSDQEITELLTSDGDLIIFYTPQGMEIGFNYDEGWVTVTYHDYREYLKIF